MSDDNQNYVANQPNNQQPNNQQSYTPPMKYCKHCGAQINAMAVVCPSCGCQVEQVAQNQATQPQQIVINNANSNVAAAGVGQKPLSKVVALLLCFFFGFLGAHKFYEGKTGMGILYLFTLGLFGIGTLIDFISLLFKPNTYYA